MDGTLVDTEPYWIDAEFALAEQHGGRWSMTHALNLVGHDLLDSGRYIREHMGIELEPSDIVSELLDAVVARVADEVPWRPGARELLAGLVAARVPLALVTMSYRRFVTPVLESLPPGTFDAVVTGDSISRGKPYPDPYLRAAAELRVDAADCLAIEDSDIGATSAERAGCLVLVVPGAVAVPAGGRRVFRDTLTGLRVDDLPSPAPVERY
jgi:HAD superfamily hydrolase (TIGR01509 family)